MLNEFAVFVRANLLISHLTIPAFMCCLVMLLNHDHKELSRNAIINTGATMYIFVVNVSLMIILLPDVYELATGFYFKIGLPTVNPQIWDSAPFWLAPVVGVLAIDFCDYWNHRLMHTKWFWPTHAAHHSDTHVNAFTTFRVHALELMLMALSYVVLLTWLAIPDLIPFVVLVAKVHNMYVHTDLPFEHGPLKRVIASPVFHRWHHADTPAVYGKNLANIFTFYDVWFGTYYDAGKCDIKMGAKDSNIEDLNPVKIYVYPFEQWARLIKRAVKRAFSATP